MEVLNCRTYIYAYLFEKKLINELLIFEFPIYFLFFFSISNGYGVLHPTFYNSVKVNSKDEKLPKSEFRMFAN